MNAPVSLVAVAPALTSLVSIVEANPALVLLEPEKFDRFYEEVAREVRSHVPDLTTGKGRDAIASLAMKVSKTKTAIDEARKVLTEDARTQIKKVDEQGKTIRDKLDALRDEVKQPLVDWRAAEDARVAKCEEIMAALKRDGAISLDDTSATVAGRHDLVASVEITAEQFGEYFDMANMLKTNAVEALDRGYARLVKEEADRAELAKLRAAEEERQRKEVEAQAAAQEAERIAQAAAEEAERVKRAADADAERLKNAQAAEAARLEAATKAAEEAVRAQTERAAAEARAAQERDHAEALAAERRRADEAEAAQRAEAERIADEARRAEEGRAATARAEAARAADREHRGKVMGAAKDAIMETAEVSEKAAKDIVLAIAAGSIPAISIQF